ncbi:aminotransferase class I/II-fold pyridoxal phosphate-dependent enzyme [Streptomyces sp. ODS28]|uniref:aminotransferase class I/II-fold pyridoxal phosphate-dependent enzyme n=1 Tax=Streptomyces sp. ODS28 TaxID=3136688 RepID=UPI0031F0F743
MGDVFDNCRAVSRYHALLDSGRDPYYRPFSARGPDGSAELDGRQLTMTGCNDYLGLSSDPRVLESAGSALKEFGTTCSGSRLLNGTLTLHEELEAELADFLGRESAAVTTTGYQASLSLEGLLTRHDVVLGDAFNHASLNDGVRLGYTRHRRYRHCDTGHLEQMLQATPSRADAEGGVLVVTDGLFSMEGDLAPLPRITELADAYGARVLVDGAHDIGMLGAHGRGAGEHLGAEDGIDVLTGTFSKCFGSLGGFVAGPREVITHLRYSARPIMYSAALPPFAAAAALTSLRIIRAEPERRRRVLRLAERMHGELRGLGFDTGHDKTPVIPLYCADDASCLSLWEALVAEGVFTNVVLPPAVARPLIRLCPQAVHEDEQIDRVLETIARCARRLGTLPAQPPEQPRPHPADRPGAHPGEHPGAQPGQQPPHQSAPQPPPQRRSTSGSTTQGTATPGHTPAHGHTPTHGTTPSSRPDPS